ncbi:YgaP-like transmembrane domain [Halorubellus salinus]|uniref:YgaP-like transmembrane domain n=1 Tax=Halorubellus salinus TaxID=755309 RepID=UPI001D071432|nr:YgaP-like transmembrane domain [Halorubellus salinus]
MTDSSGKSLRAGVVQGYRWVLGLGHERNVGGLERTIRYLFGFGCLAAAAGVLLAPVLESGVGNVPFAAVLAVSGLYLVYEAQVQYCPLNHTVGRSTYRPYE